MAPSFPRERLPHVAVGIGARRRLRMFPDDVLIGVDATDAPVFVCVVTTPYEEELVGVFQRHGDLLGALPRWTFRLMFPPHLAIGMGRYQVAFRSAVAEPYSSRIVDEMRWYFEQLKLASGTRRYPEDEPRFREDQYAFATPRCRALYRRWLTDGEAALSVVSSHAIVEHLRASVRTHGERGVQARVQPSSARGCPLLLPRGQSDAIRVAGRSRECIWS